ncbi:MAG: tRNA epoxyqueuosine(34) reductase QueG [Acidimicrobiia bacterium]|nr:MAG: tRNA epoxyqueuosine(34) reductase QueG [Acidimicrobiia bacterium]
MLRQRLDEIAKSHGCVGFGVTTADGFDDVARTMETRRADGLSADLPFTYTDTGVATDVRRTHPWAERIVAVAHPYVPGTAELDSTEPGTMRIARFAETDHYVGLRSALDAIAAALHEQGHRCAVFADDSRLVDRAAAVRAGIGWWGKSTMVLVPGSGPWVLLGSVLTDAELPVDEPMRRSCGTCVACMPACPTGAIAAPGVLDANRCLAYWLQRAGVIPEELREAVGDRLYGCDDCLTACPPGHRVLEQSIDLPLRPQILDILGTDDQTLLRRYGHFYLPGRRPRILRRNALVVAGNDGSPQLRNVVIGYLGHPDWLLRAHAAWAAARFAGSVTDAALEAARADESDARVRAELGLAIGLR